VQQVKEAGHCTDKEGAQVTTASAGNFFAQHSLCDSLQGKGLVEHSALKEAL